MTLEIIELDEEVQDYLHLHYTGQTEAQPCYLELDLEEETLTADYNAEIGNAVPFAVHHGRRRRYTIPALTSMAANNLMRELSPLMETVLQDSSIVWDGRNNIACLGEDAQAAEEAIEQRCDELADYAADGDIISVWSADDFFHYFTNEELGIFPGCDLDEVEKKLLKEHRIDDNTGGPLALEGLTQYLKNRLEDIEEE